MYGARQPVIPAGVFEWDNVELCASIATVKSIVRDRIRT